MSKREARKPFSYEERLEIENCIYYGLSCAKTAESIGRSASGVASEIRKGGGRFYNAKKAQKRADEIQKEKYENLSKMNTGKKREFKTKTRIENLEMQVEILHDCIKELMNR